MNASQAIGYLETVEHAGIAPRQVSKGMFKLLRAAARIARRAGFVGETSPVGNWLFHRPVWSDIDPRSPQLQAAIESRFPIADPNAELWSLFGLD